MKMNAGYRPKVVVISHLYPDEAFRVGGRSGGVFVREQLRALRKFCDLRVVIPRDCVPRRGDTLGRWWTRITVLPQRFDDDGLRLEGVRFAALPPRRHFVFAYGAAALLPVFRRVRAIRRAFDFDLIHAHTTVPDGIVAVWLGRIFGVPTVVTSHGGDIYHFPANCWNRATLRYTLNSAGRVIAVSSNLKQRMLALGVSDRKVTVIPNGFDPAKFPMDGNADAEAMCKRSERVILFLGKLTPRKDPLIVLQSLRLLRARSHRVRLVMVGDGPLKKQVRGQILQLGLTECVDLVGEVPHSKVPDYLRSADLLCLPSHREGWPTVIFEALSQGVPVVASRVGGNPEAIHSEDYGLLVEPGDLAGLTEALDRGLKIPWDRAKIVRYAAGFTWRKIAESISHEYQKLLPETSPAIH